MNSPMTSYHHHDPLNGKPAGGCTYGRGFAISWQNGPLFVDGERLDPNGAFVEDVIRAARDRIEFYQHGEFASEYNAAALDHLAAALECLDARTSDRVLRGVEGTHAV